MNNTYTAAGLPQQQHAPIAYLAQQQQRQLGQLHDDLGVMSSHAPYEKAYGGYNGAAGRYFSAAGATLPTTPHNTILITNNFAPQSHATLAAGNFNNNHNHSNNNIRIISGASNAAVAQPHNFTYSIAGMEKEANTETTQLYQHHQQPQHFSALLPQQQHYTHFAAQPTAMHFGNMPATTTATAQYYMSTDQAIVNESAATIEAANNSSSATAANAASNSGSTVVLDRINICINNHYSDGSTGGTNTPPNALGTLTCSTTTTTPMTENEAEQPSPIIPAIQHKPPLLDESTALLIEGALMIDEPDSTTTTNTPHTPPKTPETITRPVQIVLASPTQQSPSTTTKSTEIAAKNTMQSAEVGYIGHEQKVEKHLARDDEEEDVADLDDDDGEVEDEVHINDVAEDELEKQNATLLAPCTSIMFHIGEDVLLKRQDNRFYLGTIIDSARQQYLLRFDDKSEQWCSWEEMRKLADDGGGETGCSSSTLTPMCVACKRRQPDDVVECCERCGRGYHRGCTKELVHGSGEWLCKRCSKPMKVQSMHEEGFVELRPAVCRQLPYHVETLSWDEKHRVNEEQIYCYCGKTGKFDYNMLQCCKCRNWFHTHCMQDFQSKLLRGDSFFVFCCTVCNEGQEFLRRLQIDWVDVLHLTLYNLSAMKKHQHHKYHHLLKDIWPYVLEKRHVMPIAREWRELSEAAFMERVKCTLKQHTERFICGREIKRDHYYYALRNNGPPLLPKFEVSSDDVLSDELLIQQLKLKLLPDAPENATVLPPVNSSDQRTLQLQRQADVYEFREEEEKFTSDDDVPIKLILDKVKRSKATSAAIVISPPTFKQTNIELASSTVDTNSLVEVAVLPAIEEPEKTDCLRSSRKRKAFTLSKSYKEVAAEAAGKRYCVGDSSSDENSSSSRGTSLDLIIPPPKNFLGPNNPFRMVTPKKNICHGSSTASGLVRASGVKSSIFNTNALDFSTKLAALKSAGIFPNLSNSNLAKAAGQSRTVRTIKRRLSAKDIMIGPNQEVRRRRTRRTSANVEVIILNDNFDGS